jgi:hypothetical protein
VSLLPIVMPEREEVAVSIIIIIRRGGGGSICKPSSVAEVPVVASLLLLLILLVVSSCRDEPSINCCIRTLRSKSVNDKSAMMVWMARRFWAVRVVGEEEEEDDMM